MLFDLRGRGRRRAVRVIYGGLAILIGGGLVFFGIGGAGGGFFSDSANQANSDVTKTFQSKVTAAEKKIQANPKDAAAWAALTKAQYQLAGIGDNFNQTTATFTPKGKVQLAKVNRAWQHYLSLNPPTPDSQVASLMVQAYGPSGLNKPDDVVTAFETYQAGRPASATLYGQLALFALEAGQTRKADLAEKKALSLAGTAAEKAQIKQNIAQAKQQIAQDAATAAQQSGAPSGSSTLSP